MTIYKDDPNLKIASSTLSGLLSSNSLYSIEIVGTLNGGPEIEDTIIIPALSSTKVLADATGITIYPLFFGLTSISDGVYYFKIKYWTNGGASYTMEANCVFIDITYKCKVAKTLDGLVGESKNPFIEPTASMIHLLHYALTNGGNCGCNCVDMVGAFKELEKLLGGMDSKILEDCGC